MTLRGSAVLVFVAAAILMADQSGRGETTLRVIVPKILSAQAERRVAGDSAAPPPILILEGVQFLSNRGFSFDVLGEAKPGASRPVLASSGVVAQQPPNAPRPTTQKITLTVLLNDKAAPLLAGHSQVTLTLKAENGDAIKLDRAYFEAEQKR